MTQVIYTIWKLVRFSSVKPYFVNLHVCCAWLVDIPKYPISVCLMLSGGRIHYFKVGRDPYMSTQNKLHAFLLLKLHHYKCF